MAENTHKSSRPWRLRIGERRALIFVGDLIMSLVALIIAIYFWAIGETDPLEFMVFVQSRLQTWFFFLPVLWLIFLFDSYSPDRSEDILKTTLSDGVSAAIGLVLYMTIYFGVEGSLPRRGVAAFLFAAGLLTMFWRLTYIRVFTGSRFMHRAVIVGAGLSGQALLKMIKDLNPQPFHLVGLVDDNPSLKDQTIEGYQVLGASDCLLDVIEDEFISDVIVSITGKMYPSTFGTLLKAQELGIEISRMPRTYEETLGRVPIHYLEADWILRSFVDEARVSAFYNIFKRLIDILAGLVGALGLLVIGPFIALAILIEDGRPIIFSQKRAGKGGEEFTIYKFRSMMVNAETKGTPQLAKENDVRATKVGRFIRKTHLDETLQFINVLRGDMSFVGPRPERPVFVELYQEQIPFYRGRLLVKPGLTGWAQIHESYFATIEEVGVKLEYDLYYIKHRTIGMDIYIALRTFATMVGLRGR
ncbi:MAG: sugar transferase [Chloroflexota bacterium]